MFYVETLTYVGNNVRLEGECFKKFDDAAECYWGNLNNVISNHVVRKRIDDDSEAIQVLSNNKKLNMIYNTTRRCDGKTIKYSLMYLQ